MSASFFTAIILGGGPAGCQCALWLSKLGYTCAIIETTHKLGGLQNTSPYINDWMIGVRGLRGEDFAKNMQDHIEVSNIPVYLNQTVTAISKLSQEKFELQIGSVNLQTNNIVVATGVKPRAADFSAAEDIIIGPGHKIENYPFKNKRVAIFGGGDNAAECYGFIKNKSPQVLHLYAKKVKARKNLWTAINPLDIFFGQYAVDQSTKTVTYQGKNNIYDVLVVLYGWEANFPSALESMRTDLLNLQGAFIADDHRRTLVPGIYAIGEVANCTHPCVVTAMADGVIAAKAIEARECLR